MMPRVRDNEMTVVECIKAGTGEQCIPTCPVKCWEKEALVVATEPDISTPHVTFGSQSKVE